VTTNSENGSPSQQVGEVDQPATARLIRFHAVATGAAGGVICGLALFGATIWLLIKGGEDPGRHLRLLGQFFIGYDVTYWGSLVGAAYGFAAGFLLFYAVARSYNFFVHLKMGRDAKDRPK